MRDLTDLFAFQAKAVLQAVKKGRTAIFLEPGYGKTAIALTALWQARTLPALVVAPARVVEQDVWGLEATKWSHLDHLNVVSIHGTKRGRKFRLDVGADVEVISYENLVWLTDTVDLDKRYSAIIFDELSKMKTAGSKRSRRMKTAGASIPFRLGLTGTPVGNHLLDLWGEMYMVAGEHALGRTFTGYRSRFFYPRSTVNGIPVNWTLLPGVEGTIHELVKPFSFVLPPQKEVKLPEVIVNKLPVTMPHKATVEQMELVRELRVKLDGGADLIALQASAMAMKLRQFASGAVYTNKPNDPPVWSFVHGGKMDALSDLIEELQGEPLLVFYWFQHELERLKRLPGVATLDDKGAMDAWNARKLPVLLAHPQSAGHGLNLQAGGHNVCWFTLPWSWELWRQANGRLARTGQTSPVVQAHVLECGEADRLVLAALTQKGTTEKKLLAALTG